MSAAAPTTVTVAPAADPRGFLAVEDEGGFRVGVRSDIAEVFPGVDARVFARGDGAKLFLVLKAPPQDPVWTFRLDVPKGATLEPDKETGGVDVLDATGCDSWTRC